MRFIQNYIELMRIRYTEDVAISFTYPTRLVGRVDIPPLIFIVFIENAFKHGISYNTKSFINIDITYEDGYVKACFENSVNAAKGNSTPGIGLDNVRKRLDLIYGEDYDLNIEEHPEKYSVTLKIPTLNSNEMHSN
jgi:sensor histidine kinase YesM